MIDPLRQELLRMIEGNWPAQCLSVACHLGIPEALRGGGRTAAALAEDLGAQERSLGRFLRALTGLGILEQDGEGVYSLTEKGRYLCQDDPRSLAGYAMMVNSAEVQNAWAALGYSVKTGDAAFERIYDSGFLDYAQKDADFGALFNRAMEDKYRGVVPAILQAYDFSRFRTIADLGGGKGQLLLPILAQNFNARGILFELPPVAEAAKAAVAEHPAGTRCRIVGGDCFQAVPRGADLYVMKSFINNWEDAAAVTVLNNCRRAMTGSARLVIIEPVLLPVNEPDPAKMMDLQLMVLQKSGERSQEELESLLTQAGFDVLGMTRSESEFAIIEARPLS